MKDSFTKHGLNFIKVILLSCPLLSFADVPLSYTGRLVNTNGSPVTGPVDLILDLAYINPDPLISPDIKCSTQIDNVPLSNGVFHLKVDYTNSECGSTPVSSILANATFPVALRVTDTTTASPKAYSFQAIHAVPYAGVASFAKSLAQMGAIAGQVLSWNGTQWIPASAGGMGSVTSVGAGAGLTGGPITSSGSLSIATAGITAAMLSQMGASTGNTLKWTGSAWAPSPDSGITSETDPSVQGWAKNNILPCNSDHTLKYDALLNSGAGGLFCSAIALDSDDVAEGSNLYFTDARARSAAVANAIADGVNDIAPSQNSVFDALALKQNLLSSTTNVTVGTLQSSPTLSGSTGIEYGTRLTPTINQSSTAGYTALLMNVTETAVGSGLKKLLDLQVGGVSKFSIDHNGVVTSSTSTQGTTASYTSAGGNQLSVGYDTTNKMTMNVDSLGLTTFNAAGTAAGFNFAGGSVGIGSPSPQYPLDVNGSVGIGNRLFMARDGGGYSWVGARGTDAEPGSLAVGFHSNSSETIDWQQFMTAGQEQMRISSNGFVGIGSSAPQAKLDVNAGANGQTAPVEAIRISGPNNPTGVNSSQDLKWNFFAAGSAGIRSYRGGDWDTYLQFLTNSASAGGDSPLARMHISENGFIGMGTTSPTSQLHINSDSTVGTAIRLENSSVGAHVYTLRTTGSTSGGGPGVFKIVDTTVPADRFSIAPDGNIGIATSAPTAMLDIFNGSFSGKGASLKLTRVSGNAGSALYHYLTSSTSPDMLIFGVTGDGGVNADPGDIANAKMALTAGGRLGIGTIAPESKLQVIGDLRLGLTRTGVTTFPAQGSPIFFSGGYDISSADNTDDISIYRYDTAINASELRVSIGDDSTEASNLQDIFSVGSTTAGVFYPVLNVISGGKVGIGVKDPTQKFSVQTNSTVKNGINIDEETSNPYLEFERYTGTTGIYRGARISHDNSGLSFNSANAAAIGSQTFTEVMRINGGNVGIGTSNPTFQLDTTGNTRLSSATSGGIRIGGGLIRIDSNADAGSNLSIRATQLVAGQNNSLGYGYSGGGLIAARNSSDGNKLFDIATTQATAASMTVTQQASQMILNLSNTSGSTLYASTGSTFVGIGNTNPSYKLDVTGDINATGIVRASGSTLHQTFDSNTTSLLLQITWKNSPLSMLTITTGKIKRNSPIKNNWV